MLISRERYLDKIRPFYDLDIIKVLTGSRRAGKSKIIELIIKDLKEKDIKESNIIYINFENLDYSDIKDYISLNNYIKSKISPGKMYLFFDEIQEVKMFEKAINSFRVSFDCSIFITGSNSKMLSAEISTVLTGRIIQFSIYPFSFYESEKFREKRNTMIDNAFYDYLELGGYPFRFNLTSKDDVKLYLNELYNNICVKDIFTRDVEIEKTKFLKVAKYVLVNAGSDFNPEAIYNYLKSNNGGKEYCNLRTIYNYLDKLEKAFLIKPIYRYNISGKKYYPLIQSIMRLIME